MEKEFYNKLYVSALKFENVLCKQNWIFLGSGCSRRVWQRKNVVIKIPYNEKGVIDNKKEYSIYKTTHDKKYAPCRLTINNCLIMRKLFLNIECLDENNLPKWIFDLKDDLQIGIDNKGNILIYDYAEE
jgi:hypothetical protein